MISVLIKWLLKTKWKAKIKNKGAKKVSSKDRIFLIGIVLLVLFAFVGTVSATTWSVDDSGGADFTNIQDAINNASTGDTILVYSGVYYENVVVNKSVTLKGVGQPVVDANGSGSAIRLTAEGITLVGFNATNSGSLWCDVGIKVISNNNTITGNNVCNNNWGGIYLSYSSNNNTLTGNVFVNDGLSVYYSYQNTVGNNTVNGKPLVYLEDVSDYKVEDAGQVINVNCNNITIENLDLSNTSGGIALWKTENSKISNNTVFNNWGGIGLDDSSNNTITGNNVCKNNWGGIRLSSSCNNNTITGNNVCNNNRGGISLYYSSNNNTITGNNVSNNYDGISLYYSSNNNTITGNVFVNDGLFVYFSFQNAIEDNTVNGKPLVYLENFSDYKVEDAGQVILVNCANITVENLDLSNTSIGVALLNTGNSMISNNTVSNNSRKGIYLLDSSSNTITCNNVYNNKVGISISADDNQIYLNNFIDNTINDFGPGNIWNSPWEITYIYNGTTYTSNLGNYWDDYEEKYPDSEEIDTTGIWDTPYSINSDKDTYPLTMRSENYIILTQKECEVDVNNICYDWYESLSWIKENTPDPCVDFYASFPRDNTYQDSTYSVMSWCDYGNWITCIANRIPVANNINRQQTNSHVAATFFITSNESEANKVADAFDVRYVVTDFMMADAFNTFYNKFSAMTVWFGDTEGYYTQVDTGEGPQIVPSTKYFSTMVARLHIFDGRGVALSEEFYLEPLRNYRLIHESPSNIIFMNGQPIKYVKVIEYVKGAKIKGRAPNGSTVMIATNITTNQGREFMYSQMAISNGTYEFVVPYSTDGPIEGGTNFDVRAAHYVLRAGHIENETIVFDTRKEVGIAEEEVMEGKTVRVDLV